MAGFRARHFFVSEHLSRSAALGVQTNLADPLDAEAGAIIELHFETAERGLFDRSRFNSEPLGILHPLAICLFPDLAIFQRDPQIVIAQPLDFGDRERDLVNRRFLFIAAKSRHHQAWDRGQGKAERVLLDFLNLSLADRRHFTGCFGGFEPVHSQAPGCSY